MLGLRGMRLLGSLGGCRGVGEREEREGKGDEGKKGGGCGARAMFRHVVSWALHGGPGMAESNMQSSTLVDFPARPAE